MKDIKTQLENIPTTAYGCWEGKDARLEDKLIMGTEFQRFLENKFEIEIRNISKNTKEIKTSKKDPALPICVAQKHWQKGEGY